MGTENLHIKPTIMAEIVQLLGDKVIDNKRTEYNVSDLCGEGKTVALYFSAHWCPPCRNFTPKLVEFYNKLKEANKNVEIVFISFDRDEASFNDYFGTMPWKSLAFSSELKNAVADKFGVSGIPCLVVLNGQTGELITKDGRAKVEAGDP